MSLEDFFNKYKNWLENGFWLAVFALAYVAMQKAMHPDWQIPILGW